MSDELLERELQRALKRLWVYGKRSEVLKLLTSAQLKVSHEALDEWVRLDEQAWQALLINLAPPPQLPPVTAPLELAPAPDVEPLSSSPPPQPSPQPQPSAPLSSVTQPL